jgi:hypothetical protein
VVVAVRFSCLGCSLRFRRLATCTTTALSHILSHFTSVITRNYEFDTVIRDRRDRKNRRQGKGAEA